MKKNISDIFIIVVVAAIVLFFFYFLLGTNIKETNDISYYQALSGEIAGPKALSVDGNDYVYCPYDLPKLADFGAYSESKFYHVATRYSIFYSNIYVLVLKYDNIDIYSSQKENLDFRYKYKTDLIDSLEKEDASPSFGMDSFAFQSVEGGQYPKEMLFIGCADNSYEIALIYYYDQDLDSIPGDLPAFLKEERGWNEVIEK